MNYKTRNLLLLFLTAAVWGMGFVAQSAGGDAVGPFAYNCIRNFIGSAALLPLIMFRDKKGLSHKPNTEAQKKVLFKAGVLCGLALFVASSLQQVGITMGTPAGKAGFLTACYILWVPILGVFLRRRIRLNIWIATAISLCGLYLLCLTERLTFKLSDLLLLACALCFAIQIMIVDNYSYDVDGVRLASLQFLWTGIFSVIPGIVFDIGFDATVALEWFGNLMTKDAWIAILYGSLISSGVGYTLQIIAQKGLHPAVASMAMSFESVFSVIFGFLILKENLSARELIGCVVMFVAIIIAQMEFEGKNDAKNNCK